MIFLILKYFRNESLSIVKIQCAINKCFLQSPQQSHETNKCKKSEVSNTVLKDFST